MKLRGQTHGLGLVMFAALSALNNPTPSLSGAPEVPVGVVPNVAQIDYLWMQQMCRERSKFFPNSRRCPGDRYA